MAELLTLRVALIGERNPENIAHLAIPLALELAALKHRVAVEPVWMETAALDRPLRQLDGFNGIWCVPGSPYASEPGVFGAIRFAREANVPFICTGGGSQYALIEYARSVCGIRKASHSESNSRGSQLVTARVECSLGEKTENIFLDEGTRIRAVYRRKRVVEDYHCESSVNPRFASKIFSTPEQPMWPSGHDRDGNITAFELLGHRFFIGTLFQPERRALVGEMPPLVGAFVRTVKDIALSRPRASTCFYLFDDSWCFFRASAVRGALLEEKVGSVHFRGGFSVLRRPAKWISYVDTAGLAGAIGHALNGDDTANVISFAEFQFAPRGFEFKRGRGLIKEEPSRYLPKRKKKSR